MRSTIGILVGILTLLVLWFMGIGCASAATLRLTGTVPGFQNDGTCGAPNLVPIPAGTLLMVILKWTGPVVAADTITAGINSPFDKFYNVPSGTYSITASVRQLDGTAACKDTTIVKTVRGNPKHIEDLH